MIGTDVYPILVSKGISHLYHANSVGTSRSFLQVGGLASRALVQGKGLQQTPQYTDAIDQHFGIWNDVFTDSVDIHARSSSHNKYGPVLFILDARLLLELQDGVEVHVTRTNPTKWVNGQSIQDRYFTTAAELTAKLTYGDFGQMITFRTAAGIIPFGPWLKQIILDDPQVPNVFANAKQSLEAMAAANGITAPAVERRVCNYGCKCLKTYASDRALVQTYF